MTKLQLPVISLPKVLAAQRRRGAGWRLRLLPLAAAVLLTPGVAWAGSDGGGHGLLAAIGVSILAATVLAYLAYLLKQPLLLAYIARARPSGPASVSVGSKATRISRSSPKSA